jgi:hypothetical protein
MTPTPIVTALELVEDALLAAVSGAVAPAAWGLPADSIKTLLGTAGSAAAVLQHQDGGGQLDPHLNDGGWTGLVVLKTLSAADADARTAFGLASAALVTAASPTGYRIGFRYDRPIAIPPKDRIYTRAGQWRVTIRRTT